MGSQNAELQVAQPTISQRFTSMVVSEFGGQVGKLSLSPYQQVLIQHMFIGIDKALTDLEAKRVKDNRDDRAPIIWNNVNMQKLAIDSVHRVELGLDALIPNHIHVVPYFNNKLKKYDLDLSIGYAGKDYYKRKMAMDEPDDIIYKLVHETDEFEVFLKDNSNPVESYRFKITNPFKRGKVVGGFGYIVYADPTKNRLVLVDMESFNKSKAAAKTKTFWNDHPDNMMMVCVVRRTTAALNVDPEKINTSYAAVELDDNQAEINENANQEFIDVTPGPEHSPQIQGPQTKSKPEKAYLTCPPEIDRKRPRKDLEVCHSCKNKDQCDPYVGHMVGEQQEAEQTPAGQEPDDPGQIPVGF